MVSRGRSPARFGRPSTPTRPPVPKKDAAQLIADAKAQVSAYLIGEAEAILAGGRLPRREPAGGLEGDARRGAADLFEVARRLQAAGQPERAQPLIARACAHQNLYMSEMMAALRDPDSASAAGLWEANGLSSSPERANGRMIALDEAESLATRLRGLREGRDPSDAERDSAADHGLLMLLTPHLRDALGEGRLDDAVALIAGVQAHIDGDGPTGPITRRQLEMAAALERGARVDEEHGRPRYMIDVPELRFRDVHQLHEDRLWSALGARYLGLPRAGVSCEHEDPVWVTAPTRPDDLLDCVCLSCIRCGQRLSVVPAHRLPETSTAAVDCEQIMRSARADEGAYILIERRSRAILGERVPPIGVTFDELRAAEGIADLDPARHLADRDAQPPARTGTLAGVLSAPR